MYPLLIIHPCRCCKEDLWKKGAKSIKPFAFLQLYWQILNAPFDGWSSYGLVMQQPLKPGARSKLTGMHYDYCSGALHECSVPFSKAVVGQGEEPQTCNGALWEHGAASANYIARVNAFNAPLFVLSNQPHKWKAFKCDSLAITHAVNKYEGYSTQQETKMMNDCP